MGLRLDVVYLTDLQERLKELQLKLDDWDPLWSSIDDIMVEHEQAWFASNGEGTWPKLADYTIKDKARRGYPPETLIREGDLLASLTDPESAGEVGQGRTTLGTFTRKSYSWGSDEPTAQYHQDGRETPNFMPARPVIVLTPHLLRQIEDAQEGFLDDLIKEAGLG